MADERDTDARVRIPAALRGRAETLAAGSGHFANLSGYVVALIEREEAIQADPIAREIDPLKIAEALRRLSSACGGETTQLVVTHNEGLPENFEFFCDGDLIIHGTSGSAEYAIQWAASQSEPGSEP